MQSGNGSREELLQALNQLEGRATRVKVPLSYTDELYALRNYIEMVRSRLQRG